MYEIRTLIFMRTRVLLLDGHTIQVLPFLKAYAALNVEVTIFCEINCLMDIFPDITSIL